MNTDLFDYTDYMLAASPKSTAGTFRFSKKALYLIKAYPMLSNEMKKELIDKINSTKDENILEEVYRILEIGAKEIEMIVLSDEQKDTIDKGLKDFEDGNYLSNDEANRQIEEWLKK